jgi:hypothetical protein
VDQDQKLDAFVGRLRGLFETFSKPLPSENAIEIWFALLGNYELVQLDSAFVRHIASAKDNFPKPSDILALLPKDPTDWPTAAEALSEMMLVDGGKYMLVTQEHIAGFEAARPLLEVRDRFNAGKAFEAKYEALVIAERNAGRRATWFMSLPNGIPDDEGFYRREAITDAVRIGRVSRDFGRAYITDQLPKRLLALKVDEQPAALLAGPTVKSEVDRCREALKPNYEAKPAPRDKAPEISEADQQKAEQQRKVDDYLALEARERELDEREAAIAAREAALGGAAA